MPGIAEELKRKLLSKPNSDSKSTSDTSAGGFESLVEIVSRENARLIEISRLKNKKKIHELKKLLKKMSDFDVVMVYTKGTCDRIHKSNYNMFGREEHLLKLLFVSIRLEKYNSETRFDSYVILKNLVSFKILTSTKLRILNSYSQNYRFSSIKGVRHVSLSAIDSYYFSSVTTGILPTFKDVFCSVLLMSTGTASVIHMGNCIATYMGSVIAPLRNTLPYDVLPMLKYESFTYSILLDRVEPIVNNT